MSLRVGLSEEPMFDQRCIDSYKALGWRVMRPDKARLCMSSIDGLIEGTVYASGRWKVKQAGRFLRRGHAPAVEDAVDHVEHHLHTAYPHATRTTAWFDGYDETRAKADVDPTARLAEALGHGTPSATPNSREATMTESPMKKATSAFATGLKAGGAHATIQQARKLALKRLDKHPQGIMLRVFFQSELGEKLLDGAIVAAVLFGPQLAGKMLPDAAKDALEGFGHHATVGYGASVGADVVTYLIPFLGDLASVISAMEIGNVAEAEQIVEGVEVSARPPVEKVHAFAGGSSSAS